MKRRQFISGLAGAAAWPLAAQGQAPERMRRVGVLIGLSADDPEAQARMSAFVSGLQELGWKVGSDIAIEARWGSGELERFRTHARELAAIHPDIILVAGSATGAVLEATRTIPVVFVQVADPVGAGFANSLTRPGGNATGFTNFEFGTSGKWLELLKEIAPTITRAAILRDASVPSGVGQLAAIQSVASALGVELTSINVHDAGELQRSLGSFAQTRNSGIVVVSGARMAFHRELIIRLAAKHALPAVYPFRYYVASGGLLSYGPNNLSQYTRASTYVDRILKGEKPADLPVLAPTKYDLIINLKTARSQSLTLPPSLLARADEVME